MNSSNKSLDARLLNVSPKTLSYQSKQEAKDWTTKQMIEGALRDHPAYGHKRLADHLSINKKRVLRVMKIFGIKPYRRYAKPLKSKKTKGSVFPNLLLFEKPLCPGDIWATDFTYVRWKGKWWYVATIIDLFTREIYGMSIMNNHSTQLVLNAMADALLHHPPPRIIHSDQGSEYKSKDFTSMCRTVGIVQSMSHPGCPWENGYQESFYKGFKLDLGDPARFETLGEFVATVYKTLTYYNTSRIHSAFGMAPREFAQKELVNYN